jgi:hypothetical protein
MPGLLDTLSILLYGHLFFPFILPPLPITSTHILSLLRIAIQAVVITSGACEVHVWRLWDERVRGLARCPLFIRVAAESSIRTSKEHGSSTGIVSTGRYNEGGTATGVR